MRRLNLRWIRQHIGRLLGRVGERRAEHCPTARLCRLRWRLAIGRRRSHVPVSGAEVHGCVTGTQRAFVTLGRSVSVEIGCGTPAKLVC